MGIAEDMHLEKELTACLRNGPICSVTEQSEPDGRAHWRVGLIEPDPNRTVDEYPHTDVVRERLRTRAKDLNADAAERQAAAEALRVMYREKV
jgi:hypothetical protein